MECKCDSPRVRLSTNVKMAKYSNQEREKEGINMKWEKRENIEGGKKGFKKVGK
jgi:hypothetical protein